MKLANARPDDEPREQRNPGRPQSEDLDRAILEATVEILSQVGSEALHISAVARKARTTTPAIYRRFANKADLVFAALEMDLTLIAHASDYADHGCLRDDLIAWTRSIFQTLSPARTRILASLNFQAPANNKPLALLSSNIERLGCSQWSEIIRRAVERGELDHDNAPMMIGRVPGGIAMHLAMLQDMPKQLDGLMSEMVDTVMLPALIAACRMPR